MKQVVGMFCIGRRVEGSCVVFSVASSIAYRGVRCVGQRLDLDGLGWWGE
jgi:hypothetical protein